MMPVPLKIYPTSDECQIKNKVSCPTKDCKQTFTSESNLNLHLCKTHKTYELASSPVEKWYFCPEANCPWSDTKHFKSMKPLRQHFLKMHLSKTYSCVSCRKSFPTEIMCANHRKFCNVLFTCLDCKAFYNCYDTLKTHCRRKKHKLLNKADYIGKSGLHSAKSETMLVRINKPILPKKSISHEDIIQAKRRSEDKQTETTQILITQHTQTGSKNHVETQTVDKNKAKCDNFKNIKTQTDLVQSRETSCNTSFDLNDFAFNFNIEKSTQTYENILNNISVATHTDTNDLLTDFDPNFFNCNMETQTDLMFENDIFNSDYYSNMYTQTCDEILSGLNGLADIQTQTGLNESLRSVESQTLMSSADRLCPNILKDIVHSETQTDAEYRQMLEIINS